MVKILITYATDYGNTKKMAESVASGAQSVNGSEILLKSVEEVSADDLRSSHAIIIGTPGAYGESRLAGKLFSLKMKQRKRIHEK